MILAELERSPSDDDNTEFLRGNPSNGADLGRAGGDRVDHPDCYTCVEVMKSENRQHFERTSSS